MAGQEQIDSDGTLVSPKDFMRQLRPELYSDSEIRSRYNLSADILEYHLETLTARNETHAFEIFCRKLCEHVIAPNLRPATGPEGGGDSKADTETLPVSDEISITYTCENVNGGKERWAFAFSAKKDWVRKTKEDVKGIAETNRGYKKIFVVTSRFARAKTRAALEDKLSALYSAQVTILDRTWIIDQVIHKDNRDLAVNYLGVGSETSDKHYLGPEDYSRVQQLEAIEQELSDPEAYRGVRFQRVADALVAAKLSRGLERPRTETEGRFARAIRLAQADGTFQQQLEANYERIWTAYWWFDDIKLVSEEYAAFEASVILSDSAKQLELLSNLLQLLYTSVIHKHLTNVESQLEERSIKLADRLQQLSFDKRRPNNALGARVSLLLIDINKAVICGESQRLPEIWPQYSQILADANGLGEFDANRLIELIKAFGKVAGSDTSYSRLVDDLASFVSERTSEAQGALILLSRAEQLDFDQNFEIVRLLGRAIPYLTKKEHSAALIKAAALQSLAYRSAGLLWASRANCLLALGAIVVQAEEDSAMPTTSVTTLMLLAWISLELGYLPDALDAVRLARSAAASLQLTEESSKHFEKRLDRFDILLACDFLAAGPRLTALTRLPDPLLRLGLPLSRMWLLYALGYEAELRSEGWIDKEESPEHVLDLAEQMVSQRDDGRGSRGLFLNDDMPATQSTSVLGIAIGVDHSGTDCSILACEFLLSSIEAVFATLPERRTFAFADHYAIRLIEDESINEPMIEICDRTGLATLRWPKDKSPVDLASYQVFLGAVAELAIRIMLATCAGPNLVDTVKDVVDADALSDRLSLLATQGNSRHRVFNADVPRISAWNALAERSYDIRDAKPSIKSLQRSSAIDSQDIESPDSEARLLFNDHRRISNFSIIDIPAWDRASWAGAALGSIEGGPPVFGLIFRNEASAREIFQRWREKFSAIDGDNAISVAVTKGISESHPHHYRVTIASLPKKEAVGEGRFVAITTRAKVMEPDSDSNLSRFLEAYAHRGYYLLLPAVLAEDGQCKFVTELAILKRELSLRAAPELDDLNIDSILHRPL